MKLAPQGIAGGIGSRRVGAQAAVQGHGAARAEAAAGSAGRRAAGGGGGPRQAERRRAGRPACRGAGRRDAGDFVLTFDQNL